MTSVLLAIVMFTAIVLLLVLLLMSARNKLVATGDVSIVVNEDESKALKVAAGGTLLGALTSNKIFVPAACGGKGACGVCEVIVKEGGGALMPTETGFISPGEAKRGCRLACQVKVKRDMRIEVAPEIFSVRKWQCKVISNRSVSTFIKELRLELPEGEEVPFRAGGYVQIEAPPHELSYRVVFPPQYRDDIPPGKMSSWLFALKPGDRVTVSGPFGEFFAKETDREMCFVAAGAGMAPMRSHIFDQLLRLKSKRKMTFWYSCRNIGEAFYIEEFNKLQAEPRPEDNYKGSVGLVRNKVLRTAYLDKHPAPEDIEFYLCGPDVMNKAVTKMCLDLGVDRENIMYDDFGL